MSTSSMNEVQLESEFKIFGEDEAHARLLKQLGDRPPSCNLRSSSQRDIRSIINCILASSLKEVISLRDRARLNTMATIHAGAWLWALPNPNLGLAMSAHEFVIAIRIWLEISLFSFPPLSLKCVCGQVLDSFGDHLVICGHGPFPIKRHDALSEVIYPALLTENKYAKREQRCSGNDSSRSCDIFHPDFLLGLPGFFDEKVANSL